MGGTSDAAAEWFPPAPWRLGGRMWCALARCPAAPPLPGDLAPLLPGRAVLMLVRYLSGTLRYDELIVGQVARHGARVGLYVQLIVVDDAASLRGGRAIWGLPKHLAEFRWTGDEVRIGGDAGPLAVLRVGGARRGTPSLPLPLSVFGAPGGARGLAGGALRGRIAPARITVTAWSPTASVQLAEGRGAPAVAVDPFRMRIDAPRLLGTAGEGSPFG